MPPEQKGLAKITKIAVIVLVLFIAAIGGLIFRFKNAPPPSLPENEETAKKSDISPLSKETERDFRRMMDIKQLQASLKTYHDTCGGYPLMPRTVIFGWPVFDAAFGVGCPKGTTFGTINGPIPVNPEPGGTGYQYCSEGVPGSGKCGVPKNGKAESYIITFKLEGQVGELVPGEHTATPKGIK